jgi:lysophospholipase L1-like esterase
VAGRTAQLDPKTDRVKARNAAAAALMAKEGVPTNDLFATVIEKPEWYSPDGVHFNPKGTAALADQVAAEVRKALRNDR